jgi:DUF4097 and DUF4098 domain-containing protein YvlB
MYEFQHAAPVTIALRAHSGSVEISAEPRDTIEVEVVPVDDNEAAREAASNTRVILEDETLLVQVPGSEYWHWRRTPKLRITVKVPAGSALAGKSASADVHAAGVYSLVQLDAASAAVRIEEITGDAQMVAASGDLTVGRVGGALRIRSSSGRIQIGDVTGDVSAETASGGIAMRSGGGSLGAKSASGSIEVGMLRQGQARISTSSGDVQVGVAPGTGVWLDLNTASGRSTSDLARKGETPPADESASLELRVRTASGDIHVHRAAADLRAA